jgi:alkyl sulfatase BDS1-like metallo-beta-lactamase superfamily hydrolase
MSAPLYYATSLEKIAEMFDAQAEKAKQYQSRADKVRDQLAYGREAATWRDAAQILRSTKLTTPTA